MMAKMGGGEMIKFKLLLEQVIPLLQLLRHDRRPSPGRRRRSGASPDDWRQSNCMLMAQS